MYSLMSCDASLFAKTGKIFALATTAVCGRELMIKPLDADEAAEGYTKLTVCKIFIDLDGSTNLVVVSIIIIPKKFKLWVPLGGCV